MGFSRHERVEEGLHLNVKDARQGGYEMLVEGVSEAVINYNNEDQVIL